MTKAALKRVTITRIINAPPALVFQAWTDPKQLAKWWGPDGFTSPIVELDVRPGGSLLIHMQDPNGAVNPMRGTYQEVIAPERIVYTDNIFEDEHGIPQFEGLTIVTFAEYNGKTKLTIEGSITKAPPGMEESLDGMEMGWNQSLDRLTQQVENAQVENGG
jgi:uncharacterized protein YndB with AHSA1/START domain